MNHQEKIQFGDLLVATLDVYGAKLTPGALSIWTSALEDYPLENLRAALSAHVKNPGSGKFAPKPADLIELLGTNDGRPGADEAWSMCPMSEAESAYWTTEAAQAFFAGAADLIERGDQVGARMAFRETYTKRVADARANKIPVAWTFSQGHDKHDREVKMSRAISLGMISLARAKQILPLLEYHPNPNKPLKLVA